MAILSRWRHDDAALENRQAAIALPAGKVWIAAGTAPASVAGRAGTDDRGDSFGRRPEA